MGPLAVAKFKVLAETETTIGLEDVVIGDRTAQELDVVSFTGATITPTAAGDEIRIPLVHTDGYQSNPCSPESDSRWQRGEDHRICIRPLRRTRQYKCRQLPHHL